MSTFNPYSKAIKESINVDFKDRHSPQKVILCNRENQFYGEFVGAVKAEEILVNGGRLNGVCLSDSFVYDGDGNPQSLSSVADNIAKVVTTIDEEFPVMSATIAETVKNVQGISADVTSLSSLVSSVSSDLDGKIGRKVYMHDSLGGRYTDLSVMKVAPEDYVEYIENGAVSSTLSDALFVVDFEDTDAFGRKIINVANGTEMSDAVNLGQVRGMLSDLQQGESVVHNRLENAISTKVFVDKYETEGRYADCLSVLTVTEDKYNDYLYEGKLSSELSNALFVVSGDGIDAYGERVHNVADAVNDMDAVNRRQMKHVLSGYEGLEQISSWDSLELSDVGNMLKFIFKSLGGLNQP